MAIVTPDASKKLQLAALLGSAWTMHLSKNDPTSSPTLSTGDFTEADFTGYSSTAVGSWTVAGSVDGSDRAVATANTCSFTASADIPGGQICFWYYVTDGTGALMYCERLSVSANFVFNGDELQILATYRLGQI